MFFSAPKEFDGMSLFSKIYGDRAYGHPRFDNEWVMFELLLKSLHESGEISEDAGKYSLKGKALETIAAYEEQERRHRDNVIHNRQILGLTFVLTVIGILQVDTVEIWILSIMGA